MTKIARNYLANAQNKDLGMQKNHERAVSRMLEILTININKSYSFIDAGCGNGWVVRKMLENHSVKRPVLMVLKK